MIREGAAAAVPEEVAAALPETHSSGTEASARTQEEVGSSPAAACVSGISDDHEDAIDANVKFRKCQKQTLSRAGNQGASGAFLAFHPSVESREAAAEARSTPKGEAHPSAAEAGNRAVAAGSSPARP